ncbi:YhcN/YlaJ family sporulation lipoprotein [Desulforamulus ruminis]|uniref:Sporulation lipoprotein, YhcN/YlaJ family n=1 Tax=Desulforamulus ruminis (strain ATCC 23193 / DSM 2154 / NCIMB 8452 / DL) TaxID=696281 RepID=F6DV91_DESRL|nr:YhcN/YlaJ family sporulation lipoprotein [Desulforamulus ruminis]AEG60244.1 sporulation lipoprotein, YhcN/YlaJ family [Desulforamulus ruminis DSM 2154]
MKPAKIYLLFASALLAVSLVFGGCTAAKKPATPNTQETPNAASPTDRNYPKDVADRVVAEANKVEGVRGSTAVISGKNVYLGLDLDPNLEKNSSAEVERKVLDRVKDMEKGYTVSVSSDVDTVTRIKNVARGISEGKPIASFNEELRDIGTRIQPKTEKTQ